MSKIKILGFDYKVKICDPNGLNDALDGEKNNEKLTITIKNNKTKISTLIHEILEALNDDLALGLQHDVIDELEAGLRQVFLDNGFLNLEKIKDIFSKGEKYD